MMKNRIFNNFCKFYTKFYLGLYSLSPSIPYSNPEIWAAATRPQIDETGKLFLLNNVFDYPGIVNRFFSMASREVAGKKYKHSSGCQKIKGKSNKEFRSGGFYHNETDAMGG
jgi:hypothetical protein